MPPHCPSGATSVYSLAGRIILVGSQRTPNNEREGTLTMIRLIKITRRFIFIVLISLSLSQGLASYAQQQNDQQSQNVASQPSTSKQPDAIDENLSFSSFPYVQSEPLLLLLAGIAILVAATTIKKTAARKRSSLR